MFLDYLTEVDSIWSDLETENTCFSSAISRTPV